MAKLTEGENLKLSATDWNRHEEASDDFHLRRARGVPLPGATEGPIPTDVVKVLTTIALARGSVVELGARLVDDLEPHNLIFARGQPGPDPEEPFGILRQATDGDTIGEAQVRGTCIARVNVADEDHRFARVTLNDSYLTSAANGPVRLIDVADGTGEQEMVVELRYEPRVELVELTSLTKQGDFYGGALVRYDPATDTFTQELGVWLRDANE